MHVWSKESRIFTLIAFERSNNTHSRIDAHTDRARETNQSTHTHTPSNHLTYGLLLTDCFRWRNCQKHNELHQNKEKTKRNDDWKILLRSDTCRFIQSFSVLIYAIVFSLQIFILHECVTVHFFLFQHKKNVHRNIQTDFAAPKHLNAAEWARRELI